IVDLQANEIKELKQRKEVGRKEHKGAQRTQDRCGFTQRTQRKQERRIYSRVSISLRAPREI
ncbi:MAG TPA: hypothetical protein VFX58_06685, partial [Chitinophagaceae bacterium]|nr:hypothetical protein [Chitinophagaceae bacterium]